MTKGYLGIDIGSISTKGVIIDENRAIIARSYLWTEGNPTEASTADLRVHAVEGVNVAEIHLQVLRFNQHVSGHCYAASFPAWKQGPRARRPGSGK